MKSYIETLQAAAAKAQKSSPKPVKSAHAGDARPLAEQIEALMASLPPIQRDRPWSMSELVAQLHGRFKARPHPMHIGQALRALGWTQKRDWTRDGGGRRFWIN